MGNKINNRSDFIKYNKKMWKEYKRSLKHIVFDETLTLYIFRPIAFIFVKLLYKTPITPNQISMFSIFVGILSGIFFSQGTLTSFIVAGLLYTFSIVLDCVDGMIARLKKNGSAVGRIIDGFADYIVGISVYVGFTNGLIKAGYELPFNLWILITLAAISHIFHAMIVDYYRMEFMSHGLGKHTTTREDNERFTTELESIKHQKGKILEKILISVYIGYSHLQMSQAEKVEKYDKKSYFRANKMMVLLWFWIGPTAHAVVIILSAFLFRPEVFLVYTIILANIWMLVLWIIQVKINRKVLLAKVKN